MPAKPIIKQGVDNPNANRAQINTNTHYESAKNHNLTVPENEFQNLSFENLMNIPVHTGGLVLVNTPVAAKKEDKVTSKENFLKISFEGLMRIPVRVATLTKEQKEKEAQDKQEVSSSPINLDYVLTVFSTQALKIMNGTQNSVPHTTEDTTTATTTATATTSTLPVVPIVVLPVFVPKYIAVANNVFGTVSVLFKNSNGTFSPQTVYTIGGNPLDIVSADFNGDGLPDLAVTNGNSSIPEVSILLATAIGAFGSINNFTVGNNARGIAVGDFNGDKILDLATANSNSDTVSILLGTGTGAFHNKMDYTVDAGPVGIAVGDFNRDGKLDIVVVNTSSGTISVLLGTGNGNFILTPSFPSGDATSFVVAVGDFNTDNILDFAVSGANSGVVSIFLGTGNGTFSGPTNYSTNGAAVYVATGDFNEDGFLDLVLANATPNTVAILLGTGLGTFGACTNYPTGGASANQVKVADFNADGHLDLAVVNSATNNVSILFGNGQGLFQNAGDYPVGIFPTGLAIGFVPAGVSGYPINLALDSLSTLWTLRSGPDLILKKVNARINKVPLGWELNAGIKNEDGSWTLDWSLEESDSFSLFKSLSIRTPDDFVGAQLFTINMSLMLQDGTVHQVFCFENVEAYAPGFPIVALPLGDNLSGCEQADLFVISKATSEHHITDHIFNFDVQSDSIDLLNFETVYQFSDLKITDDGQGNAIISLGADNHNIILYDVQSHDCNEKNILFGVTPYTYNTHIIDIGQGAVMPFMGLVENDGVIQIDGKMIIQGDISGTGKIILGVEGVLELQGSLNQDLIFETGSGSILFKDLHLIYDNPSIINHSLTLGSLLAQDLVYELITY